MIFFTAAGKKHTLQFKKLSEYNEDKEELIKLVASWAKKAWGYLHQDDKKFYQKDIHKKQEQIYVATFYGQPVAMFGLFEKGFDPFRIGDDDALPPADDEIGSLGDAELKAVYFDYVFVEERLRGLGFARQLLEKAKALAIELDADLIYLDTLNPKLNNMYIKLGAKVICEGQYLENPTDVLSIKL
ncbi:putative Acyl-CoA N-acyltransferase [Legionella steigerwaltii]|uniref:Acyl-CoA N-acyltransferase n=1 Tax=Legionella steigerwaltii TaxID=460 RepID=A0A378LE28_9GAMM|nr:GNAT family N-acetyltransferase [Legionella steigerwaltii]KTD78520.1 putative Acyl-CoA N-acyltransferase [Legionella steigerwaltii]STY24122.1 putative Acyl-CoA N-acyltransferase [Legionella steigerwaltii]